MNVPSYEALLDKETRIKVLRELCENVNKALNSQMSVAEATGTSVEAEVGKYYRYADPVASLVVTLPQVSGTSQPSNISFFLTTGSDPDIKFESDADVYLSGESTFSDDTSYYITATYDGAEWVVNVSIATFQSPPPQHEYVDLGLPSGTLWATMNVGASSETDYGNYYMYGMGSKTYDSTDTPYDGTEDPLDLSKDTARQVYGGNWHMPTRTQMEELIANTTYELTTINGIKGGKFTATNGNYVFLPAAGWWEDGSQYRVGNDGSYWGSSPDGSDSAYILNFDDGYKGVYGDGRKYGYSVRPVIG
jgi:hypothetical protein